VALPVDLIELLREFDTASVRYLLIGGHALGFHATPRFTKDVDFWVGSTEEDLRRLEQALRAFAAPDQTVRAVKELQALDVAWMGNPPLRFDFMKNVPGGQFEDCYARRVITAWEAVPVSVISVEDLIHVKRSSGRPQDMVDVDVLERLVRSRSGK
jgi:hypothetical protein